MATRLVGLFDIGATHTRVGLARRAGELQTHETIATNPRPDGLKDLFAALDRLADGAVVTGLVGGIAGQIDPRTGCLYHATNLPQWNGLAVGHEFDRHYGLQPVMANDTTVVGLGEAVYGAGRGYARMMYETVSTGVNASLIINGSVDRSAFGFEVGQQLLVGPDGRLTSLEAATGGAALERQYGRPARQLASQGLWRSEERLLALALYNSLAHWAPDVIVFGGSMMRDIKLEAILSELKKLPPVWPHLPKLVHAQLGDIGGLHGAMALARQENLI